MRIIELEFCGNDVLGRVDIYLCLSLYKFTNPFNLIETFSVFSVGKPQYRRNLLTNREYIFVTYKGTRHKTLSVHCQTQLTHFMEKNTFFVVFQSGFIVRVTSTSTYVGNVP